MGLFLAINTGLAFGLLFGGLLVQASILMAAVFAASLILDYYNLDN